MAGEGKARSRGSLACLWRGTEAADSANTRAGMIRWLGAVSPGARAGVAELTRAVGVRAASVVYVRVAKPHGRRASLPRHLKQGAARSLPPSHGGGRGALMARALGRSRGGRRRPEPARAAPAGSPRATPAARGRLAHGAALLGGCTCLQMHAEGAWAVRARASSADAWVGRVLATDSPRACKERALSACERAQWYMFRLCRCLSSRY